MKTLKRIAFILIFAFITQTFVFGQICNLTSGYIGNTFDGSTEWVQNSSTELDVAEDGTMVTTSRWDEAGRCIGVWKDGHTVTLLSQPNPNDGCWGWGTDTEAAAIDNNYLYVVNCKNNLLRWNRKLAYSYVDKTNVGLSSDTVFGMTYSAGFLYLVNNHGLVEKRSVSSLSTVALSFTVKGGYDLAVDNTGNIWVLTINKEVLKFNASGINTGTKIASQTGWSPSAVNFDAKNTLLLVPDNGSRRQVIKFNTAGAQVGTFGDLGGISGGPTPGLVGDLRFWNIVGCGTDIDGNTYVALDEKGTSLRKFNSSGVKQWEVKGLFFVDITSIDPASDGSDIYGANEHMKYDYSTNSWSLHAITCDAIANPTDPRIKSFTSTALMRRVNGNLLMFAANMVADNFDVYRFNGEIAVFCQKISGIGFSGLPDKNGNIWYAKNNSIRKIPLTGFTNGIPVFGPEVIVASSLPAPMTGIERLEYDADKDVMYIGGWTPTGLNERNDWGIIGSTIARYPNWSTGNRTASHKVVPPKDDLGYCMKAMSVAGDYVFTGLSRDVGKVYVYNANDLSLVGNIPAPATMPTGGWLDVPHAIQAYKRLNGQYLILVEEDFRGKNIIYHWCPNGDCTPNDLKYPDLVPSEFKIINANNEEVTQLTAGQTVRFKVKVSNKGNAVSPAGKTFANGKSFKIKFNITNLVTSTSTTLIADTITQALAPGQSTQVVSYSATLPFQWDIPKGQFSITTLVNPVLGANIVECNRTNNNFVFNFDNFVTPYFLKNLDMKTRIADFGDTTSFSVQVLGEVPIHYKWYVNGVEQLNIDSKHLLLSNLPMNLNGAKIKVTATNLQGSTTSNEVTLTVLAVMKLTGGSVFASSGEATSNNAFDGNLTTFYDGLADSYMGVDYGSPKKVAKIKFYPRTNWSARMEGGKFQGSNDNKVYTDIYTINFKPIEKEWTTVVPQIDGAFRYLRYQGPPSGYGNVTEIEFWTLLNVLNELVQTNLTKVSMYPNPVNNRLFLSVNADKIIVTGIDGREVCISKGSQVDLTSLKNGIYLVKYLVGENFGISKIIKQ